MSGTVSEEQRASLLRTIRQHNPGSALADELERLSLGEVTAYLADFAKRHPQGARR
jgi:DNA-binding IscR family transcriptional regulator